MSIALNTHYTGCKSQGAFSLAAADTPWELSACFSGITKVEAESVSPLSRYFGRRACVFINVQFH
jgi:hypothetical protein